MNGAARTSPRFGAHVVVDALVDRGVTVFFANPGTSEIHLVAAIDANPGARAVLCLFEGVATGAADGYARATGAPAAVLLHLGPGLANGLANLHNALKARSPMIVIVGEHAASHLRFDSPLRSDLDAVAGYAAKAVFHMAPDDDLQHVVAAAVAAASVAPAGPVVIVANADVMWKQVETTDGPAASVAPAAPAAVADRKEATAAFITRAEAALRAGPSSALLLGGKALSADAIAVADRIAQATGCALFCETFNARHERGAGVPKLERVPYFAELAIDKLKDAAHVVLVGSRPPVAFFGSPDGRSALTRSGAELVEWPADASPPDVLADLARRVGASDRLAARGAPRTEAPLPTGALKPHAVWAIVNRLLPRGSIISDEAGVSSVGADDAMATAEPHVVLNLTGGSIGQGIPVATGAAIGCPAAKVIAFQGDGGAMYTLQALWTQARERADVVNVIFRNDRYAILDHEVQRHQLGPLGAKGAAMFELTDPPLDWVRLADGMGMSATSATTAEAFCAQFADAIARSGPALIEVRLGSKRRDAKPTDERTTQAATGVR